MKLFMSVDQAKIIRDALYNHRDALQKQFDEKKPTSVVADLLLGNIQEQDRLLRFLNDEIVKETQ